MLFLASEADPLNVATEALIAWSVVVNDALSAIDEPLILATIAFLDVDADELNADIGAVDDPLIFVTITSLDVEADPPIRC